MNNKKKIHIYYFYIRFEYFHFMFDAETFQTQVIHFSNKYESC